MDPLPAQAAFDAASFAHLFIQHPDMKHPLGASEQGGRAELINEIQVRNSRADGSDHCGSTPQVSIETEHRRGVKEGNKHYSRMTGKAFTGEAHLTWTFKAE